MKSPKDIKKEGRRSMKCPTPEEQCAEGLFQIQPPSCAVHYLNIKVSTSEKLNMTFEISKLSTSKINPSKILYRLVRALSSSVYPMMVVENFQIYSVQITGKCICETFPLSFGMIGSLVPIQDTPRPPQVCKKGWSPHKKVFLEKAPILQGDSVIIFWIGAVIKNMIINTAVQSGLVVLYLF